MFVNIPSLDASGAQEDQKLVQDAAALQQKLVAAEKVIKDTSNTDGSSVTFQQKADAYKTLSDFYTSTKTHPNGYAEFCTDYAQKVKADLKTGIENALRNYVIAVPVPNDKNGDVSEITLSNNGQPVTALDFINNLNNGNASYSVSWDIDDKLSSDIDNQGQSNPAYTQNCPWLRGTGGNDDTPLSAFNNVKACHNSGSTNISEPNGGSINLSVERHHSCKSNTDTFTASGSPSTWSQFASTIPADANNLTSFSQSMSDFNKDMGGAWLPQS